MKVYELIARAVEAEGTEVVFAVMGDGNMKWLTALEAEGRARVVYCRHESSAAAMAEGYARATGRPGICSVTCGPGLTLIATTLVIASRNRTPLVVIAGDSPRGDVYYQQSIDQRRFAEACEAAAQDVRAPATTAADVLAAFVSARLGRPVVLSAAFDLQDRSIADEAHQRYRPSTDLIAAPQAIAPEPAALADAVGVIRGARRVAILAGRGAIDALTDIEALAERTGAVVATSLMAKGLFNGHPRDLGLSGGLCTPRTRAALTAADCVIAFGTSLSQYTTDKGRLVADAKVVQVALEPNELIHGRRLPVGEVAGPARADVYLQADAGAAARALLAELREPIAADWDAFLAELDVPEPSARDVEINPGTMHPRDAVQTVSTLAAADTRFVVGLGHFWWFATTFLTGRDASAYQFTTEFGAIGQGFTSALGTSVGLAPRPIVLVEGDASMMMTIQELDTAVRHGIDLVVVVMNDSGLGAEFHKLDALGVDSTSARIRPPAFAEVAQAFGARGATATSPAELGEALVAMQAAGGVGLIDARLSPEVINDPYWSAYFAGAVVG